MDKQLRTIHECHTVYGPGVSQATVPAGVRVIELKTGRGEPYHVVDDLSWMDEGTPKSDAINYGIPVAGYNVEEVDMNSYKAKTQQAMSSALRTINDTLRHELLTDGGRDSLIAVGVELKGLIDKEGGR